MQPGTRTARRLVQVIRPLRWAIPLTFSLAGFGYTFWETVLGDGYSVLSAQALMGFGLLGVLCPLLTFATLTWAERAARASEEAERALQLQYQQQAALNTISRAVNQSLELETVLNRSLDHVLTVLQLEFGEVRLLENDRLILHASRGVSADFVEKERNLPLGECVCGACAVRGELIAVPDLETARVERTACACEQFRSILSMPVQTADRVVGVIHVGSRTPRTFDASERALVAAIGNQVGTAIEKAQLHAELKALNQQLEARVEERTHALSVAKEELAHKADALHQVLAEERRVEEKTRSAIAADLHDGVQQIIIGALYETQAAREAMEKNQVTARERLAAAQDLLARIGAEMRGAIFSLRPLALDAQGLVPALRECVLDCERMSHLDCRLDVEGTPRRFDADGEVAAFRIVQETLNNVHSHAQARQVRVRVCFRPRELAVDIEDDGQGFDMDQVMQQARTHLGLIGMQERAESVGGALEVWSHPGKGTHVHLVLPMAQVERGRS